MHHDTVRCAYPAPLQDFYVSSRCHLIFLLTAPSCAAPPCAENLCCMYLETRCSPEIDMGGRYVSMYIGIYVCMHLLAMTNRNNIITAISTLVTSSAYDSKRIPVNSSTTAHVKMQLQIPAGVSSLYNCRNLSSLGGHIFIFQVIHQQTYSHTSQVITKTCQNNCFQVVSNHFCLLAAPSCTAPPCGEKNVLSVPGDATHSR